MYTVYHTLQCVAAPCVGDETNATCIHNNNKYVFHENRTQLFCKMHSIHPLWVKGGESKYNFSPVCICSSCLGSYVIIFMTSISPSSHGNNSAA